MFITGFVTLFITIAPSIAYIGAASRLAYTLAQNGSAPQRLSLLSRRYSTPVGGLLFLMVCFAVILLVYSTGIVSLATLIQIPNATFILTYLGGSAAGLVLLKESGLGRIVSGISFLLTGAILFFVGWAIVWPVLVTIAWWIYRTITIKDLKAFYQNRI